MTDWIDHDGLSIPVDGSAKVLVRFRDGFEEKPGEEWEACNWITQWYHYPKGDDDRNDIVAYKVVK